MKTARLSALAVLAVLAALAAGCGGSDRHAYGPAKLTRPRSYAHDVEVRGVNLGKANKLYKEGEQLYMKGGVGVPERQRKRNLSAAIKKFSAARSAYRKALRRHPGHMKLQSRVRDCDMHIDGCRRMLNLNISGGMKMK